MSKLALPDGWMKKPVRELCGKPQYGFTASAIAEKIGPKFLRITDIQDGCVNWDTVPYCECSEPEKYRLSEGDILFTRTGCNYRQNFPVFWLYGCCLCPSYLIRISRGKEVLPSFYELVFPVTLLLARYRFRHRRRQSPKHEWKQVGGTDNPFSQKNRVNNTGSVARIEELTHRTEEARKLATEREAELDTLLQALYCRMIEGV